MSLSEISQKLKEKGFSTDKTYLSKLQNGKIPAAGEKINTALAEILNGDATMLELLAFVDKSPDIIKLVLTNFDKEFLELLAELMKKYPEIPIDLLGTNILNIEYPEEIQKINNHSHEIIFKLLSSGQSDYINELTLISLKEKFDGLLNFKKHENSIRETLKNKGLESTINLINTLISSDIISRKLLYTKNESNVQIKDTELLEWYQSLPRAGEKKLRKLRAIWEMMQDDE